MFTIMNLLKMAVIVTASHSSKPYVYFTTMTADAFDADKGFCYEDDDSLDLCGEQIYGDCLNLAEAKCQFHCGNDFRGGQALICEIEIT